MRLIDADKFLEYLIFSKHIDSLKCKEVKEAVEMCKVDVLEQIRDEIKAEMDDIASGCLVRNGNDGGYYSGLWWALKIVIKHMAEKE